MRLCKSLVRTYLASPQWSLRNNRRILSSSPCRNRPSFSAIKCSTSLSVPLLSSNGGFGINPRRFHSRRYSLALESSGSSEGSVSEDLTLESPADCSQDTVAQLLSSGDRVERLMKMERKRESTGEGQRGEAYGWFPYLDMCRAGNLSLSSSEVLEALDPYLLEVRKERFRNVVRNRSYSVCLVVEGLTDFGNVSAAFRSADALGIQSVHVVSCDCSKRCIEF